MQEAVPVLIDAYGRMEASLAATWFEERCGGFAFVPDSYRPDAWQASVRWALTPMFKTSPDGVSPEGFGQARRRLEAVATRHVRQFYRDTLDESVRRGGEHIRYARALQGESCDFCVMLASRGPVYGTRLDAGGEGNKYHDHCDCVPVPVKGYWVPDDSPRGQHWEDQNPGYDHEHLYHTEYQPYWQENDTLKDTIKRKREVLSVVRSREAGRGRTTGSAKSNGRAYPTLSEVPRKGRKRTRSSAIEKANPDLQQIKSQELRLGYMDNCVRAVFAAEMRYRGYNITAGPGLYDGKKGDVMGLAHALTTLRLDGRSLILHKVKGGLDEMLSDIESLGFPNGARGFFRTVLDGKPHAATWQIVDGEVLLGNPQIGIRDTLKNGFTFSREVREKARRDTFAWARIDNAKLTDAVLDIVGS